MVLEVFSRVWVCFQGFFEGLGMFSRFFRGFGYVFKVFSRVWVCFQGFFEGLGIMQLTFSRKVFKIYLPIFDGTCHRVLLRAHCSFLRHVF